MITYNGYWFLWNIIGASQGNSGNNRFPDYSYPHAVAFPYTAPCDGFLWLCLYTATGWWHIEINNTYMPFNSGFSGSSSEIIPISKNDIVNVYPSYGNSCNVSYASFFPCK